MCIYHRHTFHLCTLHFLMIHVNFLSDGRYTGMTMLLIPLHVLAVIGLFPSTPVLNITRVPLDCIMKMWVDEATDRCRACQKSIALSGKTKKRNFMDHVLRHVSITVCGLCYLTTWLTLTFNESILISRSFGNFFSKCWFHNLLIWRYVWYL